MEEIIQEALGKGVEMHVAGELDLASQLYASVIKLQPNHADANHNMGLLKVDKGQDLEALPYLQTALQADPSIAQFWLSYIRALIKLDRVDEAARILSLAQESGVKSEEFLELHQQLNGLASIEKEVQSQSGASTQSNPNIGSHGPPQEAINQLANLYNQGQLSAVVEQAQALVEQYPSAFIVWNILGAANAGLHQLDAAVESYQRAIIIKPDYPEAFYNKGSALQDQGNLNEAIEAFNKAILLKPKYADAHYNKGNALQKQGHLEEAIKAYNCAVSIKPDYADAHTNMGLTFHEQGNLEEAILAYRKALSLKPDNSHAFNNLGVSLQSQGNLEEAIMSFNKAISFKPNEAEAYVNMGNALREQGLLDSAMESYQKALSLKPDHAKAIENSENLAIQLLPVISKYGYEFYSINPKLNSKIELSPKYQIQNAIKAFLKADFKETYVRINNFKASNKKILNKLTPKDQIFCKAYSIFIGKLLEADWGHIMLSQVKNKVYHLGDSHCLSFAHNAIKIKGTSYRILPRIVFGAKAFHLSRIKSDSFKVIAKANFASFPKGSKVLLSFGEIDCRPKEGLITAARKFDKPLEGLVDGTVKGYVKWFAKQNEGQGYQLYFINVPAPIYNIEHSANLNSEVLRTVSLFNAALKKYSSLHGYKLIDAFHITAGNQGFSNGLLHLDSIHLGASALPKIEQQLT